jgi:hypothetical protein
VEDLWRGIGGDVCGILSGESGTGELDAGKTRVILVGGACWAPGFLIDPVGAWCFGVGVTVWCTSVGDSGGVWCVCVWCVGVLVLECGVWCGVWCFGVGVWCLSVGGGVWCLGVRCSSVGSLGVCCVCGFGD